MIRLILTGIAVVIGATLIAFAIGGMRVALIADGAVLIVTALGISTEIGKRGK